MAKKQIRDLLLKHVCWVTFTKKDGTLRTLRCTLVESMLPERTGETKDRKQSDEVMPVFDLDAKAWKSFRLDSFKSISTAAPEKLVEGLFDVEGVVPK